MTENQEKKIRAAVYIDGFNLYYPVKDMGEPHLKWCDFNSLSEKLCQANNHELVGVTFCTAIQTDNPNAASRHRIFNSAQKTVGVKVIEGHYVWDDDRDKYTEKQSDINVALSLIFDGLDDQYDWAYLVSADSDQAATAKYFKERLPDKNLAVVAPPNRKPPTKSLQYADLNFVIQKRQIEDSLFPQYIKIETGYIPRPREYDPPEGWLAPSQRPKRKR